MYALNMFYSWMIYFSAVCLVVLIIIYFCNGVVEMTETRKVYPDCTNISNPYHKCSEYCISKIAEANKRTGKKGSGSIILDRSFGRKKQESKYRANPLEVVNNRTLPSTESIALDTRTRFLSRTLESKFQTNPLEMLNNVPADAASPQSHSSSEIKAELTHNEPQSSSEQCSIEMISLDLSFRKEQIQASESSPESPKDDMVSGTNGPSMSRSFNTSEIEEEEQSVNSASDSRVWVGKYHVKASISSLLQSMIDKYGDIASGSLLESLSLRTYYIECVCLVVQELQSTPFSHLTKSKIKEISAILKDAESSQINVGWLLKEIAEPIKLLSQQEAIEVAKIKCHQALESTKKELESQMKDLAAKEKEVSDAKTRVSETKDRLKELEFESSRLNKLLFEPFKVQKFSQKLIPIRTH